MPWSQENKSWYINLISIMCILIKWEFTTTAGEIKEHKDCRGMWQTGTFTRLFALL